MGRLGWSLARMVGLIFVIAGTWVFAINLQERGYEGWVLAWIFGAGLAGAVGGVLFLLGIDGPERLRNRRIRLIGWVLMMALALLPSALSLVMFPMLLLTIPALVRDPVPVAPPTPSSAS